MKQSVICLLQNHTLVLLNDSTVRSQIPSSWIRLRNDIIIINYNMFLPLTQSFGLTLFYFWLIKIEKMLVIDWRVKFKGDWVITFKIFGSLISKPLQDYLVPLITIGSYHVIVRSFDRKWLSLMQLFIFWVHCTCI